MGSRQTAVHHQRLCSEMLHHIHLQLGRLFLLQLLQTGSRNRRLGRSAWSLPERVTQTEGQMKEAVSSSEPPPGPQVAPARLSALCRDAQSSYINKLPHVSRLILLL